MALWEGLSGRTLQAGPYAHKSLYSFKNWGVSLLGSHLWLVCVVLFCVLYVTQAYSICTKKSLLGEACCYGGKSILKLVSPWGLFLFYVSVVVVVRFPTFHWVAFCRIKWIKIKEPVVVAFFFKFSFFPVFPSARPLHFFFCSSMSLASHGWSWGGRGSPQPWATGAVLPAPSHLCLSDLVPDLSHPVSGPSSQPAAHACQPVIQQKDDSGSREIVKGPMKRTLRLSRSDRWKAGRSPENNQDVQIHGGWHR